MPYIIVLSITAILVVLSFVFINRPYSYMFAMCILLIANIVIITSINDVKANQAIVYNSNGKYTKTISKPGSYFSGHNFVTVDCSETTASIDTPNKKIVVSYTINPDYLVDILNQYNIDMWRSSLIEPIVIANTEEHATKLLKARGINVINIATSKK